VRFTARRSAARLLLVVMVLVGLALIMGGHVEHALLDLGIAGDLGRLPILDGHLAKKSLRSAITATASRALPRRLHPALSFLRCAVVAVVVRLVAVGVSGTAAVSAWPSSPALSHLARCLLPEPTHDQYRP